MEERQPSPPPCGLLSLPTEIRLQIYTYLLCLPPLSHYQKRTVGLHHGRDDHVLQQLDEQQYSQHRSSSPLSESISSSSSSTPSCSSSSSPSSSSAPRIHAALLLANRQIHHEATPILYSTNTFLAHPSLLASFPRLRTHYPPVSCPQAASRIRRLHLRVSLDCCDPPPWGDEDPGVVARAFTGLDELSVHVAQAAFLGSGPGVLRPFEEVRGVARAAIGGSVTGFEDYAEWLCEVMRMPEGVEVKRFEHASEGIWAG